MLFKCKNYKEEQTTVEKEEEMKAGWHISTMH